MEGGHTLDAATEMCLCEEGGGGRKVGVHHWLLALRMT